MIGNDEPLNCPVCQARFRGSAICSRCGADLAVLLLLIDHAYRLRREARKAIETGDVGRARELADEAEAVCSTEKGRELLLLSSWLLSGSELTSGEPQAPHFKVSEPIIGENSGEDSLGSEKEC